MFSEITGIKRPRWGYGILFSLMLAPVGMLVAAYGGARFLVPADAGMAAGAMVLLYGILGLVAGIVSGAVLAVFLPDGWLRRMALVTLVAGLGAFGIMAKGFLSASHKQQQAREETLKNLPSFEFVLSWSADDEKRPFTRFEYRSMDNSVLVKTAGSAPQERTVSLEARSTFLSILREFDLSGILRNPHPCQQTGPQIGELTLTIHEALPPKTSGRVIITRDCLKEIRELERLAEESQRLWRHLKE